MNTEDLIRYAELRKILYKMNNNTIDNKMMLNRLVRKSKYCFLEDVGANIVGDAIFTGFTKLFKMIK